MKKLLISGLLVVGFAGMVPVGDVIDESSGNGQLPAPELEDLLHFAIRNSNLTKLREMAEHADRIPKQSIDELIEAFAETDRVFRTTVTRTLVSKDWGTEEEFLAALELIGDYGDHLVDKGDLINKMGALGPLLEWVSDFKREGDRVTPKVGEGLANLLVELTQNREETKRAVLGLKPDIVETLTYSVIHKYRCLDAQTDQHELCAALLSAVNSMIANNPELQQRLDDTVFVPLAESLTRSAIHPAIFTRLISTFRALSMERAEAPKWMHAVDLDSLLEKSEALNVFVGQRVVELATRIHVLVPRPRTANLLHIAQTKLYVRCMEAHADDEEICRDLKPSVELEHSSEL